MGILTREAAERQLSKFGSSFVLDGILWCFCYVAQEEQEVADALGLEARELPFALLTAVEMDQLVTAGKEAQLVWITAAQLRGEL